MKAAIYCRITRPDEHSECTLSKTQLHLLRLIEQEGFELFAIYVDEIIPPHDNSISLHCCLNDLKNGLFQVLLFI